MDVLVCASVLVDCAAFELAEGVVVKDEKSGKTVTIQRQ